MPSGVRCSAQSAVTVPTACHPSTSRRNASFVVQAIEVVVVSAWATSGGQAVATPSAHPPWQSGSSTSVMPVVASWAAVHGGGVLRTTASVSITVGVIDVSRAPAVAVLTADGGPTRVVPTTRSSAVQATTHVPVDADSRQVPAISPPRPAGLIRRAPSTPRERITSPNDTPGSSDTANTVDASASRRRDGRRRTTPRGALRSSRPAPTTGGARGRRPSWPSTGRRRPRSRRRCSPRRPSVRRGRSAGSWSTAGPGP